MTASRSVRSCAVVVALLCGAALTAQVPAPSTNPRVTNAAQPPVSPPSGAKSVLTRADFTYIGSFELPPVSRYTTGAVRGFAHRRVNGQLRFFANYQRDPAGDGYGTIEVVPPATLSTNPDTFPSATVVRQWGVVGEGKAGGGSVHGLYWDEQDQRLYYSGGDTYTPESRFPSLGYVTLNDSTGAVTNRGPWFFTDRSAKMAMGGVVSIPAWWAQQFAPGRRLAACCGGYFSLATSGPISIGPALTAFDPSTLAALSAGAGIANRPLLGYPFNPNPYTDPQRAQRDTDYRNDFDNWNPKDGKGYWTWTDWLAQGGTWIDTPTKSGVVFFPTMSNGRTWYERSTLNAERYSHSWFVYAPSDLGLVASGKRQEWQIQPVSFWSVVYPGMASNLGGWSDYPDRMVAGSTYDETTRTLYVCVKFGRSNRNWPTPNPALVHAYRVAG